MPTLATDNFDRANNADIGANWDVMTSEVAMQITSNTVKTSNVAADASETYNAISFPADQYSQAKITSAAGEGGAGEGYGVLVRGATGARTYYRLTVCSQITNTRLTKFVSASNTTLANNNVTYADGKVLYLGVKGSVITMTYDGVVIGTPVSDSAISSGRPGITESSTVNSASFIDDWEGGNIETPSFRVRSLRPRVFAPGIAR